MRGFAGMPIDGKLKLVVFATTALTLILAYACLFIYDLRAHRRSLERNLNTLAKVVAANSTAAVEFDDRAAAREILAALQAEPQVLGACIYDNEGQRIARYVRAGESVDFPRTPSTSGFHGARARLALSQPIGGEKAEGAPEPIGTIYLVADYRGLWARLATSAGIGAVVMLASLLLGYLLSGPLRRFISAPIVALAETTRAVSKERNYALRAEKQSDDEIGQLIDGFNEMLTRIEERDAALHAAQRELEQTNETLEQQKATAIAASKAKDQFLAMLSHELRTPLTPVLATIDSLENGSAAAEDLAGIAAMIRRNVELEARLIDDLLDITRISRGKLSLSPEPLDIHSAIRSVIELVRHEIVVKQLELTLDFQASAHFVNADSAKLQQILWNLLRNAIKFTSAGGRIGVTARNEREGEISVQVSDSGIGIPLEALERIFDPFEQAEHSIQPRFGGLGLGLSISKGIAEAHGGQLTAASEGFGHGSTFTLTLRTIPAPAALIRPSPAPTPVAQRLRILLVEDHDDSRNALQRLLVRCGHSVVTAADFRTGIETARGTSFDLLISDIGLPDGNGTDLMRELRGFRRIKGIALSGLGMESDIQNSRHAGFSEHLIKPVSFEELKAAINRVQAEPS